MTSDTERGSNPSRDSSNQEKAMTREEYVIAILFSTLLLLVIVPLAMSWLS